MFAMGKGFGGVAMITAFAACGSGGGPTTSLDTVEGFCRQTGAAYAANSARCHGGTAAEWNAGDFCGPLRNLAATVEYDAAAAAACLEMIKTRLETACGVTVECFDQVVKGKVADGQLCAHSFECSPGVLCTSPDNTTCAHPVCLAPAAIGAACPPRCVADAVCDSVTSTCIPATVSDVGGPCNTTPEEVCRAGLFCKVVGDLSATGVCTESKEGAPCDNDSNCPLEDYCATTCVPRIKVGSPCSIEAPYSCVLLATCDPVTDSCVAAGVLGKRCGAYGICLSSSCGSSGTCVPLLGAGGACQIGYDCQSGVCSNGACADCPR
jgi:hypothetical protein